MCIYRIYKLKKIIKQNYLEIINLQKSLAK